MYSNLPNMKVFDRDLIDLNLRYFHLMREIARHDRAFACNRFGVSLVFIDRLCQASNKELEELTKEAGLLMQVRSNGAPVEILLGYIMSGDSSEERISTLRAAQQLCNDKEGPFAGNLQSVANT